MNRKKHIRSRFDLQRAVSRLIERGFRIGYTKELDIVIWPQGEWTPMEVDRTMTPPFSWDAAEIAIADYYESHDCRDTIPDPETVINSAARSSPSASENAAIARDIMRHHHREAVKAYSFFRQTLAGEINGGPFLAEINRRSATTHANNVRRADLALRNELDILEEFERNMWPMKGNHGDDK